MKPGQFCIRYTEIEHWPGMPDDWDPVCYSTEVFNSIEEAQEFLKSLGPRGPIAPERSIRNHLNQSIHAVKKE